MKRIVLIALALASLSSAVSAEGGISFGAKAGIYSASMTQVPAGLQNTSFRNGFAAGVSIDYEFIEGLSLQPEVLYVRKGFDGQGWSSTYGADFDYIEIPLLIKLTVQTKSFMRPVLFVGPSLGINLRANVDLNVVNRMTDEQLAGSLDYSEVMNGAEFSLVFGAGCDFDAGPGDITLDARLDLGLSKTFKGGIATGELEGHEIQSTVYAGTSKNIGFALMLGYAL